MVPFGYPFEISSSLLPAEIKQSIRARKTVWFDPHDGARGWVAGSLVCLWFSAFDQQGPMLLGWISQSATGSRIGGRAGSDLNGLLLLVAITPVMAICILGMALAGDGALAALAGGFFLIIGLVVVWAKHMFRRDAEPLVRFLHDTVTKATPPSRAKGSSQGQNPVMALTVNDRVYEGVLTPEMIRAALLDIGPDGFAIAASAPEQYLQTAWQGGDFVIEKRDGERSLHFRGENIGGQLPSSGGSSWVFSFDEMTLVFTAYILGAEVPPFVKWAAAR